jgi:CheY-like chemotaxis protein
MLKRLHECVLLYVEDDEATAFLFQEALRHTNLSPQFFRATDGEHALRFLLQEGRYSDAPRPDLVLLELNLPRNSGFDVLAEMRGNPRLRDIKVIVFSTSTLPYDRERSLQLGADDYLSKDGQFEAFVTVAKSVCQTLTEAQQK